MDLSREIMMHPSQHISHQKIVHVGITIDDIYKDIAFHFYEIY